MNTNRLALLVLLAMTLSLFPTSSAAAAAEPQTLKVWPGEAPGASAPGAKEEAKGKRVTGVTDPTLTVFRPEKDKDTGVALIVCPGGGYTALMMDYEGEDVAHWLNTIGITGIVLKYRIATPPGEPKWTLGVRDGQRAISLVRSKAQEWGIKPDKIGILGFSAGGHLAIAASCNFEKRTYEPMDDIDKVSCRPDFAIPIYPGGNVGRDGQLTPECKPEKDAPPTFMAISTSDRVDNVIAYYKALADLKVPAEAHFYATGKHGFGIKPSGEPHSDWPQRCVEWMRGQKILTAPGSN